MNMNWAFGPPITDHVSAMKAVRTRSLVLDTDDVLDAISLVQSLAPDTSVTISVQATGGGRVVSVGDVAGLSVVDRNRLHLSFLTDMTGTPVGSMYIDMARTSAPTIIGSGQLEPIMPIIAQFFLDHGKPRVRWAALSPLLLTIPLLALISSWIGVIAMVRSEAVIVLFGSLLVLVTVGLGLQFVAQRQQAVRDVHPGHRILSESRAATSARRADAHKDVRVVLITAPVAIALALLIAWLSGVLQLA